MVWLLMLILYDFECFLLNFPHPFSLAILYIATVLNVSGEIDQFKRLSERAFFHPMSSATVSAGTVPPSVANNLLVRFIKLSIYLHWYVAQSMRISGHCAFICWLSFGTIATTRNAVFILDDNLISCSLSRLTCINEFPFRKGLCKIVSEKHTVKRLIFGRDLIWLIWLAPKNRQIK